MLLYLHIPFCSHKCGYCTFYSVTDSIDLVSSYMDSLLADLQNQLQILNMRGEKIESVFFGGGTPNFIDSKFYVKVFECFNPYLACDAEISIESNVNYISKEWCKDLLSFGANRLSVGVQSFDKAKLAYLERNHNPIDIFRSFELARSAGFSNINADFIFDTPLDTEELISREIESIAKLDLDHISAYALELETPRFKKTKQTTSYITLVRSLLNERGFEQYEVSNYAKDSRICKHNLGYWMAKEYIGVGAGAFTRIGYERKGVPKNLSKYIENPHFREVEVLSKQDLVLERIMLGLRANCGVSKELLDAKKCAWLLKLGHLIEFVTPSGESMVCAREKFLADELALYLMD